MKLPPFLKWKGKTVPATDAQPTPVGAKPRKKTGKKRKRIIAGVVIAVVVVGIAASSLLGKKDVAAATYTDEAAARRDITTVLTATGTLAPINQYNVTTLARGEVLTCTFEEGDIVEKGQLLYTVDASDVEENIKKEQLSLQQSQLSYQQQLENLSDLSVKAKKSGVITDVPVEVGDDIKAGDTVATLRDSAVMKIKVPFNAADTATFSIGESAAVTIDGSFETLWGTISEIDGADTVLDGYQIVRNVTIAVSNPGALSSTATGTATVRGIACNGSGKFAYNAESTITAETSGTVTAVRVQNGSNVSTGSVICTLNSSDVQNQVENSKLSLKNAQLSLENTIKSLDDYKITAPISGTVVTRTTKAGDSIDPSNGVAALSVIYDMSSLKFDIALDELDVSQVKIGQSVEVQVDALDGATFDGQITNISVAGTTTNGATTYPVTVEITDPPAQLLPGMNVNASIITAKVSDVLAVPVAAVKRGSTVYVKDTTAAANDAKSTETDADKKTDKNGGADTDVPAGYHAVQVETGLSDSDYIEIISGLSAGDVVYVPQVLPTDMLGDMRGGDDMGGGPPDGGGPPEGGPEGGGPEGGGGAP